MRNFAIVFGVIFLASPIAGAEPARSKVIRLGGPRAAEAKIEWTEASYAITVQMLPVRAFSEPLNVRVSRDKARMYALLALAKLLNGKEGGAIAIEKTEIISAGVAEGRFRLVLVVPRDKIDLHPSDITIGNIIERVKFDSNLFTRKSDFYSTLDQLSLAVRNDIGNLGHIRESDPFMQAIADAEERGIKALDTFVKEVHNEKLLLKIETDELIEAVAIKRNSFLGDLRDCMRMRAEQDAVKARFSEVEIDPAFASYLLANTLLMEVTGAKVIGLPDGRRVILAVASTVLTDASAKDRLRVEKVCKLKALASVVAEQSGVQVFHLETLNERIVIKKDAAKETGTNVSELLRITKTKTEGISRDMAIVGRWRSKSNDIFYLAIGVIVDAKGEPVKMP